MTSLPLASLPPIVIRSALSDYTIDFHGLTDLEAWHPEADLILADAFFRDRISFPEGQPVLFVEATEDAKSLPQTIELFVALKQAGLGRGSRLLAVGGGVIQDIATFLTSLYMRGIAWDYVPTTFLGMADSCMGGKSSINVGAYKNLIGNFHPPRRIEILPVFARTLPAVELAGGAAEAAKIAFCRGPAAFSRYLELAQPVLSGTWSEQDLAALLHATLQVKQWFVEKDEFDRAERRCLNFGHTWGHALESATQFAIPHGLAVALGMMAAVRFLGSPSDCVPLWDHCLQLLDSTLDPTAVASFDPERFRRAFLADKKHSSGYYHLIVPTSSGVKPGMAPSTALGVEEITIPAGEPQLAAIQLAMEEALQAVSSVSLEMA